MQYTVYKMMFPGCRFLRYLRDDADEQEKAADCNICCSILIQYITYVTGSTVTGASQEIGVEYIKRFWIIFLSVLLLISTAGVLSAKTIHDRYEKHKLVPTVELQLACDNMVNLSTYRFKLKSSFTVKEREEVISQVDGEKADGNTHIKGEMVNTPVDIYYINRTIYNYDSFANKWLVIDSDTNNCEELLVSELNPLSNFRLKSIGEVQKIGFEEVDGAECLVVRCQPTVESQLLESMWKEFDYQFWVDYRYDTIRKATLTAKNLQNADTALQLTIHFYDLESKIEIKPPLSS